MPLTNLRKRVGSLIFRGGLTGVSYLGRLHPRARPHRHGIEVLRNLAYRPTGADDHRLDLYVPVRPPPSQALSNQPEQSFSPYRRPHPIVLYVHGGAFRILSKETHWVMGLAFARRGFLVFNINYRLAPRHPFPAALEDACAALEYVIREAVRHGGDPNQIVLAGESAGANLVTSLALLTVVKRPEPWARRIYDLGVVPRAVVPMCGMLQVTDTARFTRRKRLPSWLADRLIETTEAYLGRSQAPDSHLLADPLLLIEQLAEGRLTADRPLPPFFASVGTRDPLLDDTRRLEAALKTLGVPHEARYYPGEVHAFQALVFRELSKQCWQDTYAFLDRQLRSAMKDPGQST